MAQIEDISPTWSNTHSPAFSVNGRMLSLACSQDGEVVFAGSLSNDIWASEDGGRTWDQVNWEQPAPDVFDVPGSMGGFCVADIAVSPEAGRWRVGRDLRLLADIRGIGRADIVGFGATGVWTALSNGDGSFQEPRVVLADFGYEAGSWDVERHPRFLAVLTSSGFADIVGFGDAGVWTALSKGDGTFQDAQFVLPNFGYEAGGWRVEKHPRFLAVLTDSGFADIVGFGDAGVWTALSDGSGGFKVFSDGEDSHFVLPAFGYETGGWRVDRHPRFLAVLTDSGFADIVGFGDAGVWTALGNGDGSFQEAHFVLPNFGYEAGSWDVKRNPRCLAVLTSSGFADIVGFGDAGVWTALSDGSGGFRIFPDGENSHFVLPNFGSEAGSWDAERNPRFLAVLTDSGFADIVGFGDDGVWTALSDGNGGFTVFADGENSHFVLPAFGYGAGGWRVERHPRLFAVLTDSGFADIVGFGDAGVWTALSNGDGSFSEAYFVLANFGYQLTVLAMVRSHRELAEAGIWRSSDGGQNWTQVRTFPLAPPPSTIVTGQLVGDTLAPADEIPAPPSGQIVWAPGSGNLVYAADSTALAISRDGGATFRNTLRVGRLELEHFEAVNHVAVAPVPAGALIPPAVYALRESAMFVSFDGGVNWKKDPIVLQDAGGAVGLSTSQAASVLVVSPRSPFEVFLAGDGFADPFFPMLWRGAYSMNDGTLQSSWAQVRVPDTPDQDSGNAFLAATQPGRGDLLFLGQQRSITVQDKQRPKVYVGPVDSTSAADWKELDDTVHPDLHGILLSPDFAATFQNGAYHVKAGTVWMLSDGGIYWSTDGGQTFHAADDVKTLSCLNVAGVAIQGQVTLSLNTGDNDGFFSRNGGMNWTAQDYGGGDNDCSYADPLRPHSMLVFTPRWDTHGTYVSASEGQTVSVYETTPGQLPDASTTTNQRHVVPGPPLGTTSGGDVWNASSPYGARGFRPIVLNLGKAEASTAGDYIFIRWKSDTEAVLLRTQQIRDINSRDDWETNATGPGQGARVFQQGPALPDPSLNVVQASGGRLTTAFYVGHAGILGSGRNQLWVFDGTGDWQQLVPGGGAADAFRFFVDPYVGDIVYLVDSEQQNVMRSDDGGRTWQVDESLQTQLTRGGRLPVVRPGDPSGQGGDVVLTDMQFDPNNPNTRFAVGLGGAFMTNDGVNWTTLLDARALPGLPANCYYDWISNPDQPALYLAFAGRGLVKISTLL